MSASRLAATQDGPARVQEEPAAYATPAADQPEPDGDEDDTPGPPASNGARLAGGDADVPPADSPPADGRDDFEERYVNAVRNIFNAVEVKG